MKQTAFALSAAGIVILVVIALFSIEGKSARDKDLRSAVRECAYEALGEAVSSRMDDRELSLLFRRILISKLADVDDAGESMEIEISAIDARKGLLSARVSRDFTYPNGNPGTAKADCTVILEEEARRDKHRIRYFLSWNRARELGLPYTYGNDTVAFEYIVEDGRSVPVPEELENAIFTQGEGEDEYSARELGKMTVGKDMDLYEKQR